jgi:hypothetical protein
MPLPLETARGLVAATISLWLGSTLHLLRHGALDVLVVGISSGQFETAWLGAAEFAALEQGHGPLPRAADSFRLLICDGLPPARARGRLIEWLGAGRLTGQTGRISTGVLYRHPGLAEKGEPFVGALCA